MKPKKKVAPKVALKKVDRKVFHIIVGDKSYMPSIKELEEIAKLFKKVSPTSYFVATNYLIKVAQLT